MRIILADFDFGQIYAADVVLGPIFFFAYVFFVFIILVVSSDFCLID
jgi:Polycystin cation channel